MNYIISYFTSSNVSNYAILNETNIFNSLIHIFEMIPDDKRDKFFEVLVFETGKTFVESFKNYVFRKSPKHDILNYI
jgi:hypothetical protein